MHQSPHKQLLENRTRSETQQAPLHCQTKETAADMHNMFDSQEHCRALGKSSKDYGFTKHFCPSSRLYGNNDGGTARSMDLCSC